MDKNTSVTSAYEKTKADADARSRCESDEGRDIGPINAPANPVRDRKPPAGWCGSDVE